MAAVNHGGKATKSGKNTETPTNSIRYIDMHIDQANACCLNLLFMKHSG